MTQPADICVIGAGAAGLWAAMRAAESGRRVVLLEKTPRTGTKVLASGGTKCNLTTTLGPQAAAQLFGQRGGRFLRTAFRALSPQALRDQFEAWGVATVAAPLEKIFPRSGKAVHVRDALERGARAAGVEIVVDAPVGGLERRGDGWAVLDPDGGLRLEAPRVILSPGGKSFPSTGTTGDGYAWLEALGCEMVPTVPALVPLVSDDAQITELTGIAVQDVIARLVDAAGRVLGTRQRPVLFTHHGASGPGAMDLSGPVARARLAGPEAIAGYRLQLDLVPGLDREQLRDVLVDGAALPGAPRLSRVLDVDLPRRLIAAVCDQARLDDVDPRLNGLDKSGRHRLVEALKAFTVPLAGTLGFDKAEVTAGGLALTEVDAGTMAIKRHPGLFACGEILDLDGPIGGLNFQSAWATAELAGRAAHA